ncbi:hypothetical protein XPA_009561 [Xanthoria parietina]
MASSSKQGASGLPGRPKGPLPLRRFTTPFAQQTPKPLPHPTLKQASHPVYMLKWENLKAILEKRFPGYTFSERRVNDRYRFDIPEDLTQEDLDEIAKATDERLKMPARRSQSPE